MSGTEAEVKQMKGKVDNGVKKLRKIGNEVAQRSLQREKRFTKN